jgi:hypothetical protein
MSNSATALLRALADRIAADGRVEPEEVLAVRRAVFPDGVVSREEAELLFDINEHVANDDPAWDACFVEAICDHLLNSAEPMGHVTEEGCDWLIVRIDHDSVLERVTELELALKLLEKAESCPARLAERARTWASRAILEGRGYEGRDPKTEPGQIGDAEVAMIRRVLFAAAGAGDIAITRDEAEWLFALDEATDGKAHAASWRDLFVKAIMSHLFAGGPSDLLDRNAMLHRAQFVSNTSGGLRQTLSHLASGLADGGLEGWKTRAGQLDAHDDQMKHDAERKAQHASADLLSMSEAAWLVTRIRADHRRTPNEEALVAAVKAYKGDEAISA